MAKKLFKFFKLNEKGERLKNEKGAFEVEEKEFDLVEEENVPKKDEKKSKKDEATSSDEFKKESIQLPKNEEGNGNKKTTREIELENEIAKLKKQANIESPIKKIDNPEIKEQSKIVSSLGFNPQSGKVN